jgi:hypothetical protein
MEQSPIFVTVEQDLGIDFETLVGPPYEFAKHDAEVRRRIAAGKAPDPAMSDGDGTPLAQA